MRHFVLDIFWDVVGMEDRGGGGGLEEEDVDKAVAVGRREEEVTSSCITVNKQKHEFDEMIFNF